MSIKGLSIRVDDEMLHKLHIIAEYECRSANSQIAFIIKKFIKDYEKKYGEIDFLK